MRNHRPYPDLPNQNPHFNKASRRFIPTFKFEEHWLRIRPLVSQVIGDFSLSFLSAQFASTSVWLRVSGGLLPDAARPSSASLPLSDWVLFLAGE